VSELRAILVACHISDGKMEEGSMRVDANVSVRREGTDELRTRCEIKNVNSLRSLVRAIEYEARRQADLHAAGEQVVQQTRHWDEADGRTHTMRSKEEADDYRYFPEPDLVPVDLGADRIAQIAAALPLLPAQRRHRLADACGETPTAEAIVVAVERGQDDQALAAIEHGADPARVLVHVVQNLAGDGGADLAPVRLAELVAMEVGGELTATQAKQVLAELVADPSATAAGVAKAKGFEAMDTGALEAVVDQVIAANPAEWEQFCAGDPKVRGKLTGFFVGQIMKATKGQADGKAATALLNQRAG
jgi:aspartyl-tRNA(Asn)/glutamyl-tRNA(Gln) amidotransferase subunit B